jgi:hypothetical protein
MPSYGTWRIDIYTAVQTKAIPKGQKYPIDPYVKPFSPPDPPEMTALTGTPVLIDNEEIQTE